jgi:hypothetical protein
MRDREMANMKFSGEEFNFALYGISPISAAYIGIRCSYLAPASLSHARQTGEKPDFALR